ncbi:alpha/beta fold hydrolase [Caulobacter sp. 1776]|uniref:alpha/beta fold hydrolase n=1 Tax=Caulobacter sp. 1776 TaxID=3156420 RepID=UPI003395A34D
MATQVLFLQGAGEGTYDDWDSKLVDSLRRELGPGYEVRYPRLPDEGDPDFGRWVASFHQALAKLDDGAVLVGHSFGATVIALGLAMTPPARRLAGVFLIAPPFFGEGGWDSEEMATGSDLGARLPPETPVRLYQGDQDTDVPPAHLGLYAKAIPRAVARTLPGRDHQLNDDLSEVAADIRGLAARP